MFNAYLMSSDYFRSREELKAFDTARDIKRIFATDKGDNLFVVSVEFNSLSKRFTLLNTRGKEQQVKTFSALVNFVRENCPNYLQDCVEKERYVVLIEFEP